MGPSSVASGEVRKAVVDLARQGLKEARQLADEAVREVPTLGRDVAILTGQKPAAGVPPKKVMITYLSAGNGHRTAAEALYGRLTEMFPGWVIARPVDIANLSRLARTSASLFYKTVDWGMWPWIYDHSNRVPSQSKVLTAIKRRIARIGSGKFVAEVGKQNPDVIIHTNVLGSELQSAAQAGKKIPRSIANMQVVTDVDAHGMFLGPGADVTFAPNKQIAEQLAAKGLDPARIVVSGIPINAVYAQKPAREAVRAALGFSPDARIVLAQGNLIKDVEYYRKLLQNLAAAYPDGIQGHPIEVAIACGKNESLLAELRALAIQNGAMIRLKPFGFLQAPQMRDLMAASDLSLTKPGGLTTAESVAMDLPMVLIDVMGGGQESRNAAYFTRQGAAVTAHDVDQAIQQAVRLLNDPAKLAGMRQAASRVAHPEAASKIGETIAALPERQAPTPRRSWLSRLFG